MHLRSYLSFTWIYPEEFSGSLGPSALLLRSGHREGSCHGQSSKIPLGVRVPPQLLQTLTCALLQNAALG